MKKISVIVITVLIAAGAVYAGVQATRRQWQDSIPKPTAVWSGQYGYGDFPQMAFNVWRLLESDINQARAIVQLNERLMKVEGAADCNDVGDANDRS